MTFNENRYREEGAMEIGQMAALNILKSALSRLPKASEVCGTNLPGMPWPMPCVASRGSCGLP